MTVYEEELVAALNAADKRPCSDLECPGSGECPTVGCLFREAADAIEQLQKELKTAINELCLRCGDYKTAHLGSCDDCRWRGRG